MFLSLFSIGTGAALGAWLRWGLGLWLNPHHATLPLGTLAANLVGGYGVGLALGWFAQTPGLSPELRLFVITGLLGGLTTFSPFRSKPCRCCCASSTPGRVRRWRCTCWARFR